jgi:hypothetical protein
MAVNDIYQLTVKQRMHGQLVLNVLFYKETVSGSGDAAANLATAFINTIMATWKTMQSNEISHEAVITQKVFPQPPLVPHINTSSAGPGTVSQNALPTSMAAVLTKRTQFAGPKYRGRLYIAGIPVTYENDSQLSAAGEVAAVQLAAVLDDQISNASYVFRPVVFHRKPLFTSDEINVVSIQRVLRNQRRRQIGRGE